MPPPKEQVFFWRDPALGNMELLRATYVTHSFARHSHEGYAIGVIDAGVEEFNYQGATHQAIANNIVIVHPGEVHTGHAGIPSGWQYRMFYPSVALLQSTVGELQPRYTASQIPYFPVPVIADEELAQGLRALHMMLERSNLPLERESRFLWTFARLVQRHAECRLNWTTLGRDSRAVQQVLEYLAAHYAESVSLEQLATIAHLKPLRLLRVFQHDVGLPPHAYLLQLRINRAKALLALDMPIAQVATETGFSDQSHLNRHFKRWVGVTPGHYAKGCRFLAH